MWEALDNPQTCPHGNPIPGAGYKPPPIQALSTLDPGESRPLERISEELELDAEIMGFLDDSGFRPGAVLTVTSAGSDGTLTVAADSQAGVGLVPFIAERLFVATTSTTCWPVRVTRPNPERGAGSADIGPWNPGFNPGFVDS